MAYSTDGAELVGQARQVDGGGVKNNPPTAEQKRWREKVRAIGCIACGERMGTEIHHCAGRTAKHNKIAIGHWWILPLCHGCHVLLTEGPDRLAEARFGFTFVGRWDLEKLLYADLMTHFRDDVPLDVLNSIYDYHK